jgi:hypothetical protein
MPRVVGLLAGCRGHLGSRCILEAWRIAPLRLMWYIWKKWNARSFKDCESSVLELKVVMFKFLYTWTVAYNSTHFSSFTEFIDLCSSFLLNLGSFCILLMYSGCIPLSFLIKLIYL